MLSAVAQPRMTWQQRNELKHREKAQREWEKEKRIVERMAHYRPEYRRQARTGQEQLTRQYMHSKLFEQDRNAIIAR